MDAGTCIGNNTVRHTTSVEWSYQGGAYAEAGSMATLESHKLQSEEFEVA